MEICTTCSEWLKLCRYCNKGCQSKCELLWPQLQYRHLPRNNSVSCCWRLLVQLSQFVICTAKYISAVVDEDKTVHHGRKADVVLLTELFFLFIAMHHVSITRVSSLLYACKNPLFFQLVRKFSKSTMCLSVSLPSVCPYWTIRLSLKRYLLNFVHFCIKRYRGNLSLVKICQNYNRHFTWNPM
jgi:hypothetical protein